MRAVVKPDPDRLVAPTIIEARKLIERSGWVRGELCTNEGYCIMGAIITVQKDIEIQDMALDQIRQECGSQFVTEWNDTVAAKKNEVLKMLTRSAERARRALTPGREPTIAKQAHGSIYST